jgi:5-oxoprolinase (ATP-hydrolysing) subunit A
MKSIDLNSDMGEMPDAITDGTQESLMAFLTSVNIACGGHAGDEQTMRATIEQARRCNVAVGAHPGYPDRAHFGRIKLDLPPQAVTDAVFQQVQTLARISADCGTRLAHVKAHGALYNGAAHDGALAAAIARGVARWDRDVVMVGLAGSIMLDVFREEGFAVAAEAFADRRYEPDGSLRSRTNADALIRDPAEARLQALRIVQRGTAISCDGSEIPVSAQTICIHSDTPGAREIAAAVAGALREAGIALRPLAQE